MNTTLNIGDRLELRDVDGTWWPCVVVQVERENMHVRTDDGRDAVVHYSWLRKVPKQKEPKQ